MYSVAGCWTLLRGLALGQSNPSNNQTQIEFHLLTMNQEAICTKQSTTRFLKTNLQ